MRIWPSTNFMTCRHAIGCTIEVQQREEIRRDLAERMKFVLLDLLTIENVCVKLARRCEQNPARTDMWQIVEGGNHCCQSQDAFFCV